MRMMLKAVMDTELGNEAVRSGALPKVIQGIVDQLKPEAAYFAAENGRRACFIVFDLADTAQIPLVAEPLFLGARAEVTLVPCMDLDDVQRGIAQLPAEVLASPA